MNVAIDASRNRSGGAIVHIVELLKNFKHIKQTINELHVWVPIEIANLLKEHKLGNNVFIHHEPISQRNILFKLIWQKYLLGNLLKKYSINVLFNASAGSIFHQRT